MLPFAAGLLCSCAIEDRERSQRRATECDHFGVAGENRVHDTLLQPRENMLQEANQWSVLLHRWIPFSIMFRLPRLLLCQIRLLCLPRMLVSTLTHQFSECDVCLMPVLL